MKMMFHIVCSYIRHYKKQTAALFFGVMFSAALLAGMGGLFLSGRHAAAQRAREEYGDWHYNTRADCPWMEEFLKKPDGHGYQIEKTGIEAVRKIIEEPFSMRLVYADDGYLEMTGRKLTDGHYPRKDDEIAMDIQTLNSLGVSGRLGSRVTLDGEPFILCGIYTDMPAKLQQMLGNDKQVFVNRSLSYGKNGDFLYVKFDESGKVYRQMWNFCRRFEIELKDVKRNNGLYDYIDLSGPVNAAEVIKTGISKKEYGLPYIWSQLNSTGQLTEAVILAAAAVFGAFVMYSLFQVSVIKRMAQYSVLQTLGMTDGYGTALLLAEAGAVCLAGYPAGCVAGGLAAGFLYRRAGHIFITQSGTFHTGGTGQVQDVFSGNFGSFSDAGSFRINWQVIWTGLLFYAFVTVLISLLLIKKMKKMTIRQMISQETAKHPKRRIYSIRHSNLTGILTRKFMFARKGTFAGILLSLSAGSIIFLGAFYVTENTRINNELTLKADDGLGSDIQVCMQSDRPADVIPLQDAARMQEIPGISEFHPMRYSMGELAFRDGTYLWTEYYGGLNPDDQQLMNQYHGIVTKTGRDDYAVKVNIYGYDDSMLEELNAYLIEGEINPDKMRSENSVIVKMLMDGQGNYGGAEMKAGSRLQLTTPASADLPQEALRFQGKSSWYQTKELDASALVTRSLLKTDAFIGGGGHSTFDLIMTNEQMEQNFGVSGYETISISVEDGADAQQVSEELGKITSGISGCTVRDYSRQIQAQNLYLTQKMLFYYGIAAVLLGISMLHIMNSMQYLTAARRHEFGILRAMGITDAGFRKMMAKEGIRYGIYSAAAVTVIYYPVQKVLYYFLVHVYLYLHPKWCISLEALAAVLMLNILVCVTVTLLSAGTVLRRQITDEIKEI